MSNTNKIQDVANILSAMDQSIRERRVQAVFEIMSSLGITLEDLNYFQQNSAPQESGTAQTDSPTDVASILSAMDQSIKERQIQAVFGIMSSLGTTLEDLNHFQQRPVPQKPCADQPKTPVVEAETKSQKEPEPATEDRDYHDSSDSSGYTPFLDNPGFFMEFGTC